MAVQTTGWRPPGRPTGEYWAVYCSCAWVRVQAAGGSRQLAHGALLCLYFCRSAFDELKAVRSQVEQQALLVAGLRQEQLEEFEEWAARLGVPWA